MRSYFQFVILMTLLFGPFKPAPCQDPPRKESPRGYDWSGGRWHAPPVWQGSAEYLPLVKVAGNRFVDARGDTILFRGLSIADPDKLEQEDMWNKNLFVKAKEFGARIVRIPVHPGAWRARTPEKYILLLDQGVQWCTEESLYVIIDWHSIGNLQQGLYEDPSYYTTLQETFNFWRTMSRHFAGNNTVAFFELYNEPTSDFGKLGNLLWENWKQIKLNIVTAGLLCHDIPAVVRVSL